uniref:Transmembrane protein 138 n=1 Tax=Ficedula albicollis TaxID=59894 RepID=A0A803VGI7_FICAL
MLQPSNYSLVLFLQFLLLSYDLFVNSFSELLRTAPAVQLVLFIIQDIAIVFNVIIVFLMFFNTYVFQAGLVNLLFHKFKGTILLSAAYLALSISFHVWIMNLRWRDSGRFIWTEGLQTLFVFQRLGKDSQDRGGILYPLGVQGALSHPKIPCSGSALLLLLQADSCAPGRPPLLPGFTLAPQGICPLPWLMDPWNPLESPCTPQALSGSVPPHLFSRDQPLGFWESAGGLWGIPAFQGHSLCWDWNVFGNPKRINQMRFPEAAGCLCPSAVTAALPTALRGNPARRCARSRRKGIFLPVFQCGILLPLDTGGVVWRDGVSNPRLGGRSSNHRAVRVERRRARRQAIEREAGESGSALAVRALALAPPCGRARRRRFPWRWKMAPRGGSGSWGETGDAGGCAGYREKPGWERRWDRGWGAAKALQGSGGRAAMPAPCPPSRPHRVPSGRHRSSAPLQVLLFLNGWYCATYFLLEAFVFVYKGLLLPYPVSNLVLDVVLLLLYLGIEATRIFFGESPEFQRLHRECRVLGHPQGPSLDGQVGQGMEQPGLVESVPAHGNRTFDFPPNPKPSVISTI